MLFADLGSENIWPYTRWRDAFYAWNESRHSRIIWQCFAPIIQAMPDENFKEVEQAITWWLETVANSMDIHEDIFYGLCNRTLELTREDSKDSNSPVGQAINHPVGNVTKALINLWFKKHKPNDNDTLPIAIESFFSKLCNTSIVHFRHGRVILASSLIPLFRADRGWTEKNLLPLFDWNIDVAEAKAAWEGFLWSPRLYWPLLLALKRQLLDTVNYYSELGEHRSQFAKFLTYAALSPGNGYSAKDFNKAFSALPQEALNEIARTLSQALDNTAEEREEYWENSIKPFWHDI